MRPGVYSVRRSEVDGNVSAGGMTEDAEVKKKKGATLADDSLCWMRPYMSGDLRLFSNSRISAMFICLLFFFYYL